jgi:hypothetical protein
MMNPMRERELKVELALMRVRWPEDGGVEL